VSEPSAQDRYVAGITVVSCSNGHASLGNWSAGAESETHGLSCREPRHLPLSHRVTQLYTSCLALTTLHPLFFPVELLFSHKFTVYDGGASNDFTLLAAAAAAAVDIANLAADFQKIRMECSITELSRSRCKGSKRKVTWKLEQDTCFNVLYDIYSFK